MGGVERVWRGRYILYIGHRHRHRIWYRHRSWHRHRHRNQHLNWSSASVLKSELVSVSELVSASVSALASESESVSVSSSSTISHIPSKTLMSSLRLLILSLWNWMISSWVGHRWSFPLLIIYLFGDVLS